MISALGKAMRLPLAPEDKRKAPIEVVEADCERDYFMTADEAMEYGIVDKVIYKR